jgi:hypothetical protein
LGEAHVDPELAAGVGRHFHYDFRFLSDDLLRKHSMGNVFAIDLLKQQGETLQVEYRLRRCRREMPTFPLHVSHYHGRATFAERVEKLCEGKRIDPAHPICPHRGIRLDNLPVDADGCVVCPGHGLKFSLRTGEMVRRAPLARPENAEKPR